jgi:hypothetical protein
VIPLRRYLNRLTTEFIERHLEFARYVCGFAMLNVAALKHVNQFAVPEHSD